MSFTGKDVDKALYKVENRGMEKIGCPIVPV